MATVHAAVRDALRLGAISADAVRHLALARVEHRPVRLDTARYPHLPVARIGRTVVHWTRTMCGWLPRGKGAVRWLGLVGRGHVYGV